jgi:hypothetical protein
MPPSTHWHYQSAIFTHNRFAIYIETELSFGQCSSLAWEVPMSRLILSPERGPIQPAAANASRIHPFRLIAMLCAFAALSPATTASGQITVNSKTGAVTNDTNSTTVSTVDRRFQQITPTNVPLTKGELDARGRQGLIRTMQAEQGFAMRPFPRGHKGLILAANGKLEPAGEAYVSMVTSEGLSAKPGDRLVITDVRIEHARIVFDLNGGPDAKHRFLRHVQVGTGPMMNPVIQGDDQEPIGSRLTLTFQSHVPELTGPQVAAGAADLVRCQDADSGFHRHAANQAQGCNSGPSRAGGHEHGHGAVCQRRAGQQIPRDGWANAV